MTGLNASKRLSWRRLTPPSRRKRDKPMELFLISGYIAVCIAVFTVLRIPLNRWTVPGASIGGVVLVFALIQVLNYYHPYSADSRQYLATAPTPAAAVASTAEVPMTDQERNLIAWFHQNSLLRLNDGSAAEVTFDGIPGQVFTGEVQLMLPLPEPGARDKFFDLPAMAHQPRIPVLINISDPRYASYVSRIPGGSHARTAVYGDQFPQLALVRKTLLRMSAWMNYLNV